jgi:hypothetical protein
MMDRKERSQSDSGSPDSPRPHRRPPCRLIGTDGNVYSIIGRVKRALEQDGLQDRAREFVKRAFGSHSYDEVLALCLEYVEVE